MKKNLQKPQKFHVRRGDKVMVIAGDEKGKIGTITKIITKKQRAIVEGLNIVKRAVKPSNDNPEGGFIEKEAGIHISNLMLIDPKTGEPTRIGRRRNAAGKLERYSKKSGETIISQQ
ncbi:MAG: 50S ribosomal protein L24 [Cytophagales bacterium]|nr:50S ribosomal protein L24 [Bernardetiaceae bacterium]MDW8209913.1 50S ribosomal protein L24 [Cytophagales bacterium]